MNKPVLGIKDRPSPVQWLTLSLQHLFAMFGATILVPYLVGLSPSMALISSGLGTLAFLMITKWQVPAYLGSSFAFISPIIAAKAAGGPGAAMVGSFLAGAVYGIVALVIKRAGYRWIMKLLPPIVVGPVIIVIGLGLANTAVGMAMNGPDGKYNLTYFSVALVTLAATIICSVYLRGLLSLVPILIGIVVGYVYSLAVGVVDLSPIAKAKWLEMPDFLIPFVDYPVHVTGKIILLMVPVALVTLSEHIGHQLVLSKVVGQDYIKKPGLHRSILGDGTATMISALIGGPPKTTYGENIGVLAITRVYSVYVLAGAAAFAIIFGFIGKVTALISTIPTPVMGGVSILLFGIIASSGLRMLVDSKIDFGDKRNLVISSVILVIGIGGAILKVSENFQIQGMALAAISGVILNLLLPGRPEINENMFELEENKDHVA
ncbi:NCS2 family nucleobase:cation symporter [Anoxybacillus rupiensis]|jgi:uracil permease|uniref:NCS2 family nucleobase:cation symporter n=1 Tax=Anoxybacteroides rupiense TaxID=311460 RepID=A0ABT5W140_9BACL|nr:MULTISPECIES: solute carrier family 23 protein [Anoxybacillus]KXG10480.1 Uracil permease [Anoxybacillus sp. P3H1B]MBB3906236.1 uracil permease [Anoxybacillus rupiensis]MBS2770780.1 NCS2 family nucleobase:cation symporter [Anoxybacillus rupiensis]MDE8563047.1 NCS2 family nucleobase:cation symporter [Anoxybacillus rupiensis]QHC03615.1 uracil permease [Anoxybacillus sp. PDR2]